MQLGLQSYVYDTNALCRLKWVINLSYGATAVYDIIMVVVTYMGQKVINQVFKPLAVTVLDKEFYIYMGEFFSYRVALHIK